MTPSKCSRYRENINFDETHILEAKPKFRNLISSKDRESALLSRIDSVSCYLKDLESAFSEVALFFYDPNGGDKIFVLWNGSSPMSKWKAEAKFNFIHIETTVRNYIITQQERKTKKAKVEVQVQRNDAAIILEMSRLGNGIIDRIEVCSEVN